MWIIAYRPYEVNGRVFQYYYGKKDSEVGALPIPTLAAARKVDQFMRRMKWLGTREGILEDVG